MNILFCGTAFTYATDHLEHLLTGHQFVVCASEEVSKYVEEADIVIPLMTNIDEELMKQGKFGFIQQFGVGLEGVDIEAASRHNICVARVPSADSGNADSVAEHSIMLMLMLSRRFQESQQVLETGEIGKPVGQALFRKKACIVGLGGIGKRLAVHLKCFNMYIIGVHEYPERGKPAEIDKMYALSALNEALEDADYVILCLNYKPSRHHFIDMSALRAMKKGAFLINVARGGLLNQEALLKVLQNDHLAGAGLDVFWEKPVDLSHSLFRQNVIATPHIAGVTDISYKGTARAVAENIQRFARGEKPLFTANNLEKNQQKENN